VRKTSGETWVDVENSGRIKAPVAFEDTCGEGDRVRVLTRPEEISLLPAGPAGPNEVTGKIESITYMGDHVEYTIRAAGRTLELAASKKDLHQVGAGVRLVFDSDNITILP
jgi:ABC-type Fe3+/spermidine/putrescine transport system ATPase subunit